MLYVWLEMEMQRSNVIFVKACISSNYMGVDIAPGVIELSANGTPVRENCMSYRKRVN